MRTFSSYGPVDKDLHHYVPRQGLNDRACLQLLGENPDKSAAYFDRPLILILDEFDAMGEASINGFANEFRRMHIRRINEADKPSGEKSCLLHGLALVGVRSVVKPVFVATGT
jgi:hypothetical protein